jgi:hypothetical protein
MIAAALGAQLTCSEQPLALHDKPNLTTLIAHDHAEAFLLGFANHSHGTSPELENDHTTFNKAVLLQLIARALTPNKCFARDA